MAVMQNHSLRLTGASPTSDLVLLRARFEEGISQLGAARLEFSSVDRDIDLNDLVGYQLTVEQEDGDEGVRYFNGLCVAAEFLGAESASALYAAELRPWLWLLTRRTNCRIFQDKSTPDILQDVLGDYGFWGDVENNLSGNYDPRVLCVQYQETDFDFISRLMEEAGIYYFFSQSESGSKMILADAVSAHVPLEGNSELVFRSSTEESFSQSEHISGWEANGQVTTGKVTLNDFDFVKPKAQLLATNSIVKGTHPKKELEAYMPPGHFTTAAEGNQLARTKMESEAVRFNSWTGAGNCVRFAVGLTFSLSEHTRETENDEYMITKVVHSMRLGPDESDFNRFKTDLSDHMDAEMPKLTNYHNAFQAVLKDTQYRAPLITPWPDISGIQTAIVTGPSGEEIYTDEYGRVRIKFHWHRDDPANDTSTCWVRTMTPWTGKNWGMVAVPRVGQEVVVQFEEGNPDRPLVIGMLYNADTMPPYELPSNMTQSGIKTSSSKGGDGYNELMFEDLKGSEEIRIHAEKDYNQVVENDATVSIGVQKADPGNMSLTVENDLTETVNVGDHSFEVKKGSQDIKIKKDKDETIEGKSTLTVTGNVKETVKTGSVTKSIKQGDLTRTLDMGSEATTLKLGDYTLDAKLGKVTVTAMQEIALKVGGNSVVINQSGVTIKGLMVKIEGQAMTEVKSPMTQVKGDGMLILKGGVTMIN